MNAQLTDRESDAYTRALYGQFARHVPTWFWVQDGGDVAIIAGASRGIDGATHPLRYGSKMTHQFILGEIIVRPHLVFETDHYIGSGISALLTSGVDAAELSQHGNVICDPFGRFK